MSEFDIHMIRVKDDFKSETYAKYCAKSWTDAGFKVNFFDAVTPETVKDYPEYEFQERILPAEKGCFLSMIALWEQCVLEDKPFLILEHDAYLENPDAITYNPYVDITYFGQHCMEANLYRPSFCEFLLKVCRENENGGPFALTEHFLGIASKRRYGQLSRFGRPHLRFHGPDAPVRHVIIPQLGTYIQRPHKPEGDKSTADRLDRDADLFKIVPLRVALKA